MGLNGATLKQVMIWIQISVKCTWQGLFILNNSSHNKKYLTNVNGMGKIHCKARQH